jgi:NitT/TauT family transport system ATP-binding protein
VDTPPPIHVSLRSVTKLYDSGRGRTHALGPIDLDLRRGEFFAVVGPSGCGKSTLLDIIAALAPPSSGEVTFEGRPIGSSVPDGVGVVFQENACFPWLVPTPFPLNCPAACASGCASRERWLCSRG